MIIEIYIKLCCFATCFYRIWPFAKAKPLNWMWNDPNEIFRINCFFGGCLFSDGGAFNHNRFVLPMQHLIDTLVSLWILQQSYWKEFQYHIWVITMTWGEWPCVHFSCGISIVILNMGMFNALWWMLCTMSTDNFTGSQITQLVTHFDRTHGWSQLQAKM